MKDYKLELFLLKSIKSAGFIFGDSFDSEMTTLIGKFEHPETLTRADKETALNIFRDGYKNLENEAIENRDQLRLMFALCVANLELELKDREYIPKTNDNLAHHPASTREKSCRLPQSAPHPPGQTACHSRGRYGRLP